MLQNPSATAAVQLSIPSLTTTFPDGVSPVGSTVATLKLTVTSWPTTDGSGASEVIVVVVASRKTVCGSPADVLPSKFASPE